MIDTISDVICSFIADSYFTLETALLKVSLLVIGILVCRVVLGATGQLVDNGDGTSTLTKTYNNYEWLEMCYDGRPSERLCGDLMSDETGTYVQWAVVAGHCTSSEANNGVHIKDAAAYVAVTCDTTEKTANNCRDDTDLMNGVDADQTGYTIESYTLCQDYLQARDIEFACGTRNAGFNEMRSIGDPQIVAGGAIQ